MTEEILNSAILQLKAKATERFGIIKDLYHRPATSETADQIVQHAIALAQLEGAMITLQQYSGALAKQTVDEAVSNAPETEEEELEEEPEPPPAPTKRKRRTTKKKAASVGHEELMERSATYRKSQDRPKAVKKK
tara:strand:- start:10034 stop:10438 length:405 start_codon:yes stop_codon:yes gene_type:complete